MHKFPNFFGSDKKAAGGGGGGGSGSSSGKGSDRIDSNLKQKKPRPRLERRNAMRIIDYELPSTSSTSSLSSSDDYFFSRNSASDSPATPVSAHRSRSVDIQSFDKRTSFRIQGNCPGELEIICKSLGLSGPDDFSIPAAEWKDMKFRSSSDVLPRLSRFNYDGGGVSGDDINLPIGNAESEDKTRRVGDVISLKTENPDFGRSRDSTPSPRVNDVINGYFEGSVIQALETAATPDSCSNESLSSNKVGFGHLLDGRRGRGSNNIGYNFEAGFAKNERGADLVSNEHFDIQEVGSSIIKGVRPPPLAPPPAMSLPPIDCACSTWDLLKSFAPDNNEGSEDEDGRKRDEDKGEDEDEEEEVVRYVVESRRAGGENGLLSESCSFTTSNDDDSSSSTTEPLSNNSPNARFNSPNTRFNSPNGTFKRIITYWEKGELLGRGSFGSVYEGIADGGFFFAVKEVSLLDQGEGAQQSIYQLEQEIALLSQFEHENIVQYYGTDKDDSKLYIFLELVTKGSLLSLYQTYHLQDSMVSAYTRQILHGLKYLHDRNVVHRDIKCANILVDANGYVKLADFGLAKATKLNDVKSFKGTALWMAPEVVNGRNKGYGLAADIWSLGCTVLEMLTRQFPYSHLETQFQALYSIGQGEAPRVPESLSREGRDFILECLQVNPNSRPAASQLLNHPFVQRSPSLSTPASPYHPSRRL